MSDKDFTPKEIVRIAIVSFSVLIIFVGIKLFNEWSDIKAEKLVNLGFGILKIAISISMVFLFLKIYSKLRFNKRVKEYISVYPDSPIGFGRKINYLAIKSNDISLVKSVIYKNKQAKRTNWAKGIQGAYNNFTYITAPLNNWIFVLNPKFPFDDISTVNCQNTLKKISENFEEVQFYGNHRVSGYTMWSKIQDKRIIRAFSYAGGEFFEMGEVSSIEKEIIRKRKIDFAKDDLEFSRTAKDWQCLGGNEDHPFEIAEKWSLNPENLNEIFKEKTELGIIL